MYAPPLITHYLRLSSSIRTSCPAAPLITVSSATLQAAGRSCLSSTALRLLVQAMSALRGDFASLPLAETDCDNGSGALGIC